MKFYSVVAKSYNELYKEEQIRKLNLIKNEVEVIPPLLDIGCGTGISTNFLTKDSIGIDNNKEMLKMAPKNCVYANAESLPFKDGSFNTIISLTAFQNIKNMGKALREVIRVSSNGNIVITFLKRSRRLEIFRGLMNKYFKFKEIEEDKDVIFVVKKIK